MNWAIPRGHHRGPAAQLLLHPVQHAVQHGGGAVHDAAAHAVHRVLADHPARPVQADAGQLGRPGGEGIQGGAHPGMMQPPR